MSELPPDDPDAGGPKTPAPPKAVTEAEYLRRLVQARTPIVVCLRTGETYRGYLEYYDQRFIRLTRKREPNLFLLKQDIKYLYEE